MKEYAAIIIDDERKVREALGIMIGEYCPEIRLCGVAASAEEGRELLKNHKVDFIFLDISMPKEDGFEFLRSIPRERYGIIFVTAFEEYALNAIKANAIDYLLKPVHPIDLQDAVSRAIKYLELRKVKAEVRIIYDQSLENLQQQIRAESFHIENITVADQYGYRMVKISDLMYLEADNNYTILHFSGLEKIVASRSLSEFEKLLADHDFFRIHKSILLNLHFIRAFSSQDGNFAELTDGTRLSISRRKASEFRDALKEFIKR
jgi:two-component system LytT family response regulator